MLNVPRGSDALLLINTTISQFLVLRFPQSPPRISLPLEAPMPFSIRPYRRFPVQCDFEPYREEHS